MRVKTLLGATALAGAAGLGYAAVVERNWFVLRRYDVPLLPPGAAPLRILHISDAHLTPGRHRLLSWLRSLDALEPDLVVNTGDSISHPDAVQPLLDALGPLLDRPGVFVYGSNDLLRRSSRTRSGTCGAPQPRTTTGMSRIYPGPSSAMPWRPRAG